VKFDLIDSKLKEKHILTKKRNKQILNLNIQGAKPPTPSYTHAYQYTIKTNRYRQLLTSRYVLLVMPLGTLRNYLYCNFTLSLSITATIEHCKSNSSFLMFTIL